MKISTVLPLFFLCIGSGSLWIHLFSASWIWIRCYILYWSFLRSSPSSDVKNPELVFFTYVENLLIFDNNYYFFTFLGCRFQAGLSRLSCPGWPAKADTFRLAFRNDLLYRLTCPGCPVLATLSRLSRLNCHVQIVLSRYSWPCCPVRIVLSRMSCPPSCHFHAVTFKPYVLSVLSRLCCPGWLARPTCFLRPVPAVLYRLSCRRCPVLAVLPRLSCASCPLPAVLSWLFYTDNTAVAVLTWLLSWLSLLGCFAKMFI